MRIHTSAAVSLETVYLAAQAAGAYFSTPPTEHSSRSKFHAFEVALRGNSNRRPNGGSYGADRDAYAATWDQWGVFLAAVYDADPDARCGTGKHPIYANAADFGYRTDWRFENGWPDDAHGDHRFQFQGVVGEQECTKCTATKRWSAAA